LALSADQKAKKGKDEREIAQLEGNGDRRELGMAQIGRRMRRRRGERKGFKTNG
jgi:hypothetical protein